MSENSRQLPAHTSTSSPQPPPAPVLRRYKTTLVLLVFFLPLLVIPWVLTCILDVRPISGGSSSYAAPTGILSDAAANAVEHWHRAIQVLTAVATALTVPIVSAVLTHAAVVMTQRRQPSQWLNATELLTLVDAPWSRLSFRRSLFVFFAVSLNVLGTRL
jgi:hypothetical protein